MRPWSRGGKVEPGCAQHCVRAYVDCRTSLLSRASLGLSAGAAHPAPRPAATMPPYRPRTPSAAALPGWPAALAHHEAACRVAFESHRHADLHDGRVHTMLQISKEQSAHES